MPGVARCRVRGPTHPTLVLTPRLASPRSSAAGAARILRRASLALASAPTLALAQTITTVRVPQSATSKPAPMACTAAAPKALTDSLEKLSGNSRVEIRVENDQNKLAKPSDALQIVIGKQTARLLADSTSLTIIGNYAGQALSITRAKDDVLVCALSVPTTADAAADSLTRAIRVGIGGSFDFLSGVSATDLYYDVTTFLPHLWNPRVKPAAKWRRLHFGIDGGLYNGRTVPKRDSTVFLDASTRVGGRTLYLPRTSTSEPVRRIRQTVAVTSYESVDRLGVYVAPMVQLANGLHFLAQSELVRRDITTDRREKVLAQDTVTQAPDGRPIAGGGSLAPTDTTVKSKRLEYVAVHSLGMLVNVRMRDVEFRAKPTVGKTFGDSVPGEWGPSVFTVQFRVTDFGNGFKIGGDVRGRLNGTETTFLVYLAKDFSLKKLGGFLVSGESSDDKKDDKK